MNAKRLLYTIWFMTKEEMRLHSAMIGKVGFFFFPVMIFFISFVLSVISPVLLLKIGYVRTLTIIHGVVILYGLGVGGLALAGKEMVERRFGDVALLIQTPSLLPIHYRETFLAFYFKDLIYYLLLSIIPLDLGLVVSIPLSHFAISSVLHLSLSILLSFLFSISLSFLISAILTRSKYVGGAVLALFLLSVILALLGFLPLETIFPSVKYQFSHAPTQAIISFLFFILFSVLSAPFVQVRFSSTSEKISGRYQDELKRFAKFSDVPLVAKEMLDMKRSRAIFPMVGSFVVPLLFTYGTIWVIKSALFDIGANTLFYSAMIGFFGMTVYSWQNNIDNLASFQTLPITVPQVIKVKLRLFFILTISISFAFVFIVSIIEKSFLMLPFALLVTLVSLSYTAITTAYLTGLKTNIYLFDAKVLAKFNLMVSIPLTLLCAFSMLLDKIFFVSILVLFLISISMLIAAFVMYKRIDDKWLGCSFA